MRSYRLFAVAFGLANLLCGLRAQAQRQTATRALRAEDLIDLPQFDARDAITISPDGALVAYALQDPRRAPPPGEGGFYGYTPTGIMTLQQGTDVWVTDLHSSRARNLTEGKGTNWDPVWSPDGKSLAFYSDRSGACAVWIWDRTSQRFRQVSSAIALTGFEFEKPAWTPDSKNIVFKALPEGMTVRAAEEATVSNSQAVMSRRNTGSAPTVTIYESPERPAAEKTERPSMFELPLDLVIADVASGQTRRLARKLPIAWFWVSPNNQRVAFTARKFKTSSNSQQVSFDVMWTDLRGERVVPVASAVPMGYGISVSWSPDGTMLSYQMAGNVADPTGDGPRLSGVKATGGDIYVVQVSGESVPHKLTLAEHPSFDSTYQAPLWLGNSLFVIGAGAVWRVSAANGMIEKVGELSGRQITGIIHTSAGSVASDESGRYLFCTTRALGTMKEGFARIDLAEKSAELLSEKDQHLSGAEFEVEASRDGKSFVYTSESAQHPPELWLSPADFRDTKRLTETGAVVEKLSLGPSRLVSWVDPKGNVLQGAVLLPPNYDSTKRYPMLTWVYASMSGASLVNRFGLWASPPPQNLQLFASRGYIVFWPEIRVQKGSPMRDIADAVLSGVDYMVEKGNADPERLAVSGQSNGGYTTLCVIAQSGTRFKAAIMNAGFGDLVSFYGQMRPNGHANWVGLLEEGIGGMTGPPWAARETYMENSPIFYLDKIQTPLMMQAGGADDSVYPIASDEIFVGLRRLGKEVVYLKYAGEDHVITGRTNVIDFWNRASVWIDSHVKPDTTSARSDSGLR